ncbi:MAG TPA: hypothetical protein VFE92_18615 [Dermatophilaceae bacterium]|nr:hypothetical protein [Dermatophilaceae bacterium]
MINVAKTGKAKYVQYDVERTESVFTILADFGAQVQSTTGGTAGPLNNQIPAPDRNWDGSAT